MQGKQAGKGKEGSERRCFSSIPSASGEGRIKKQKSGFNIILNGNQMSRGCIFIVAVIISGSQAERGDKRDYAVW
jgi:hypothetical protein